MKLERKELLIVYEALKRSLAWRRVFLMLGAELTNDEQVLFDLIETMECELLYPTDETEDEGDCDDEDDGTEDEEENDEADLEENEEGDEEEDEEEGDENCCDNEEDHCEKEQEEQRIEIDAATLVGLPCLSVSTSSFNEYVTFTDMDGCIVCQIGLRPTVLWVSAVRRTYNVLMVYYGLSTDGCDEAAMTFVVKRFPKEWTKTIPTGVRVDVR